MAHIKHSLQNVEINFANRALDDDLTRLLPCLSTIEGAVITTLSTVSGENLNFTLSELGINTAK